ATQPNVETLSYYRPSLRGSSSSAVKRNLKLRYCRTSLRAIGLLLLVVILLFGLAAELLAPQPAAAAGRSRFCAVLISVDSGSTPLAAYQLRFAVTNGTAKIVGIEGGEHPAFREAPFYDPKAIQNEVAIIASFNTAPAAELPKGKTRVATIHL